MTLLLITVLSLSKFLASLNISLLMNKMANNVYFRLVLGQFSQETNSGMEVCIQVIYWGVFLGKLATVE